MLDVDTFLTSFFAHEGETRYDPEKAHQYYLRTRELKGRRSASDLKSPNQKEGWDFVKNAVGEEKKTALQDAAAANKAAVDELRSKGEERRKQISEKLKAIIESITGQTTQDRKTLSDQTQAKIDALPPIPKGISKDRAAALAQDRRDAITKIRGDAAAERQALADDTQSTKTAARDSSGVDREQVKSDLKASIDTARDTYNKAKEDLKAKFETELSKEFNAIKTNVR